MYLVRVGETEFKAEDYYMESGWLHMLFSDHSWQHLDVNALGVSLVFADYFEVDEDGNVTI